MSGTHHLYTITGRALPNPPRRTPSRHSDVLRLPTYRYDPCTNGSQGSQVRGRRIETPHGGEFNLISEAQRNASQLVPYLDNGHDENDGAFVAKDAAASTNSHTSHHDVVHPSPYPAAPRLGQLPYAALDPSRSESVDFSFAPDDDDGRNGTPQVHQGTTPHTRRAPGDAVSQQQSTPSAHRGRRTGSDAEAVRRSRRHKKSNKADTSTTSAQSRATRTADAATTSGVVSRSLNHSSHAGSGRPRLQAAQRPPPTTHDGSAATGRLDEPARGTEQLPRSGHTTTSEPHAVGTPSLALRPSARTPNRQPITPPEKTAASNGTKTATTPFERSALHDHAAVHDAPPTAYHPPPAPWAGDEVWVMASSIASGQEEKTDHKFHRSPVKDTSYRPVLSTPQSHPTRAVSARRSSCSPGREQELAHEALVERVKRLSQSPRRSTSASVGGTELLPQRPFLQGMQPVSDNRVRFTITRFIERQPQERRAELHRMLKEYDGREEQLCDALTEAFGEEFAEQKLLITAA